VAIDLRHDWLAALQRAGFDAARPAPWSAEGLFAFLPPDAQDRLLDNMSALSATGSRFASENMPNVNHAQTAMQTQMQTLTDRWRQRGLDLDMSDLCTSATATTWATSDGVAQMLISFSYMTATRR
jgi:methyltransferase (TIGR00027 family)